MARVLGVSPSGDYAWRTRERSAREASDVAAERARASDSPTQRWDLVRGAPRIHAERAAEGVPVSRKRVARVMREAGLAGGSRRKGPRTTRRAPRPARRRTWSSVASRLMRRTGGGWPISPTSRAPQDSCPWPSCSTCSAAGWWAGRWLIPCAPSWSSTRWIWRSDNDVALRSSTTPTNAASPPRWPSASAAGSGAWRRRWARSGTATTTPWPRASSPPWMRAARQDPAR